MRSSLHKDIAFCMANQVYLAFYYLSDGSPEVEIECHGKIFTANGPDGQVALGRAVARASKYVDREASRQQEILKED